MVYINSLNGTKIFIRNNLNYQFLIAHKIQDFIKGKNLIKKTNLLKQNFLIQNHEKART